MFQILYVCTWKGKFTNMTKTFGIMCNCVFQVSHIFKVGFFVSFFWHSIGTTWGHLLHQNIVHIVILKVEMIQIEWLIVHELHPNVEWKDHTEHNKCRKLSKKEYRVYGAPDTNVSRMHGHITNRVDPRDTWSDKKKCEKW